MSVQTNAADKNQVASAKARAKQIRRAEIGDIRSVMSTETGRRFLLRYIALCGVYEPSYMEGSPTGTALNEGMRRIGLCLMKDVSDACPDAYVQMQVDAQNKNTQDKLEREREMDDGVTDSGIQKEETI